MFLAVCFAAALAKEGEKVDLVAVFELAVLSHEGYIIVGLVHLAVARVLRAGGGVGRHVRLGLSAAAI